MSILSRLFGGSQPLPLPYNPSSAEGLAARWVRWAASAPAATNPLVDEDGRFAHHEQPDDVFFLAGCFGGDVERRCTITSEARLFFPAFNMWTIGEPGPPHPVHDAHAYVRLNGKKAKPRLISTPKEFDLRGVKANPVTQSKETYSAVVWGYWACLAPLPEGRHELAFGGGDGHEFFLNVKYSLEVTSP